MSLYPPLVSLFPFHFFHSFTLLQMMMFFSNSVNPSSVSSKHSVKLSSPRQIHDSIRSRNHVAVSEKSSVNYLSHASSSLSLHLIGEKPLRLRCMMHLHPLLTVYFVELAVSVQFFPARVCGVCQSLRRQPECIIFGVFLVTCCPSKSKIDIPTPDRESIFL